AMLYASWGAAGFHAIDGSNDVSASFVLVLALALAVFAAPSRGGRFAFFASALVFGWAMAFKQFAVLALPPLLRHLAVAGASWRSDAAPADLLRARASPHVRGPGSSAPLVHPDPRRGGARGVRRDPGAAPALALDDAAVLRVRRRDRGVRDWSLERASAIGLSPHANLKCRSNGQVHPGPGRTGRHPSDPQGPRGATGDLALGLPS